MAFMVGIFLVVPAHAAEYTSPRALNIGDTYVLLADGFTGDEATTQPKTDANDGLNGDSPYYRRNNVARAHLDYWYTSAYQEPGEPNPSGPQWVDYKPPLTILGPGKYKITAQYRNTSARATYDVPYIVTKADGTTTTIYKNQSQGTDTVTFDLGEFDLGTTGWVRVQDPGSSSITFNKMRFNYLGPTVIDTDAPSVPTNAQAVVQSATTVMITWNASTDNVGVTGYKIYRNGIEAGISTTTSYTDTGAWPSATFSYTVSAHDYAGNNSAQSSPAAVVSTPAASWTYTSSSPLYFEFLGGESHFDPCLGAWGDLPYVAEADAPNVGVKFSRGLTESPDANSSFKHAFSSSYLGIRSSGEDKGRSLIACQQGASGNAFSISGLDWGRGIAYETYNIATGSTDGEDAGKNYSVGGIMYNFWDLEGNPPGAPAGSAASGAVFCWLTKDATTDADDIIGLYDITTNAPILTASYALGTGGNIRRTYMLEVRRSPLPWNQQNDVVLVSAYVGNQGDQGGPVTPVPGLTNKTVLLPANSDLNYRNALLLGNNEYSTTFSPRGDRYQYLKAYMADPVVDNDPPSVPTGVAVTPAAQGMQISWSPSSDLTTAVIGYRIKRNGSYIAYVDWEQTSYNDTSGSGSDSYVVLAVDAVGNESSTFETEPPSVPTNVQATALSKTSISITWTASTDNTGVMGYKVFRNGAYAGSTPNTEYVDADLQPGTSYSYRVSAYDSSGNESAQSSPPAVAATLPDADPPVITQHPEPQNVCASLTATFTVAATGSGTLSYQWQKDGADLSNVGHYSGVTTTILTVSDLETIDEGDYRCVVTNAYGTATSNTAALTVASCTSNIGISPSGHYITYNGEILHLIGDNATQCMLQNKNMNYRQWLDDCHARGIRSVHLWGFIGPRQKQDGSQIETRYGYVYPGVTPWARHTSGLKGTDQLYRWNLRAFDESPNGYWQRLRDLCSYARDKGIIVGITPFFGWPKNMYGWEYHPFNAANGGHLTQWDTVQTIANPGTEVWSQTWSDDWINSKKTKWIWENYCKKLIDDCGSYGNVYFTFMDEHSYTEGNCGDHFRDFFRSRGMKWMDWNNRRSTVDFVYSGTQSMVDKNSLAVGGFTNSTVRPYFLLEGEPYMGDEFRTSFWTMQVGGGMYHYQSDSGQETVQTGIMGYDPNVQNSNRTAYLERLSYMGHCSTLFNQHVTYLDQMVPSNGLCSSGIYALAYPGWEYVVYAKAGSSSTFTVNLSAVAGTAICRFYNPRNGNFQAPIYRTGGTTHSFTKPNSYDWVLHIFNDTNDTEPPSVPTNVQAVALSSASIRLDWSASTDNIALAGYRIYRNGAQVGTSTVPSYTDSSLAASTTYSYTVSAYDPAGNQSAQSSPPAVATTMAAGALLFEERFLTDPFVSRWSKDLGTPAVDAGNIVYSDKNGVNDPESLSLDGHVYFYNVALGPQQMTYQGQFSTAAWSTSTLSFYIKNGGTPGGTLTVELKDGSGVWQTAWSQSSLPVYDAWTKMEVPLSGTVTGIRFYFAVARTRLDEIVIEGYDTTPPNPGVASSPAYSSGSSITVNYSGASDSGSGLLRTWLWYKKDPGTWQSSGLNSSAPSGSFVFGAEQGLSGDGTYYFAMRAEDNAGNWSPVPSGNGDTSTISDGTPPDVPLVADDGAYTTSSSSIHATWSASDTGSGIIEYQYAVSATMTEAGIISGGGWQSTGMATEATRSGLSLAYGTKYYVLVKAKNGAGLWSEAGKSDGIVVVEHAGINIGVAKMLPNGSSVGLSGKVIAAVFNDCFYMQESDRVAGILVTIEEMPPDIEVGKTVNVGGTLQTVDGERRITGVSYFLSGTGSAQALGMSNAAVGGGDWFYNAVSGAGQKGIAGASGPNNIGLLVRIWGTFSYLDESTFTLDDGSGTPVTCIVPGDVTLNPSWQYVTVTGINSCYGDIDSLERRILVRNQNDIVVVQ